MRARTDDSWASSRGGEAAAVAGPPSADRPSSALHRVRVPDERQERVCASPIKRSAHPQTDAERWRFCIWGGVAGCIDARDLSSKWWERVLRGIHVQTRGVSGAIESIWRAA
jgi:hypothetical protein